MVACDQAPTGWGDETRQIGLPIARPGYGYPTVNRSRRVACPLLSRLVMLVETVFQYRTLIGKCDLGVGLEMDEIEIVQRIEEMFAAERADGRKFRRQVVEMPGIMRGDMINDRVDVIEMGPGGLVCRDAPFVAKGEIVEIVLDEGDNSYRFRARGVWLRDDGDHYRVGLAFVGMPVCLHKVQISPHTHDVVDKIANAA